MTELTPPPARITQTDCLESIRYWKARRAAAVQPQERARCGALVLAWEYQLKVLRNEH